MEEGLESGEFGFSNARARERERRREREVIMSAVTGALFGSRLPPVFGRAPRQPAAKATGGVRLRLSPRPPRQAVVCTRAVAEVRISPRDKVVSCPARPLCQADIDLDERGCSAGTGAPAVHPARCGR